MVKVIDKNHWQSFEMLKRLTICITLLILLVKCCVIDNECQCVNSKWKNFFKIIKFSFHNSFSFIILQAMFEKPTSRIFKGIPVLDKTRYPFHVQIMIKFVIYHNKTKKIRERGFCGGVLLSNKHVLTAGHCLYEKNW